MPLRLVPIANDHLPAWIVRSTEEYAADLIVTGKDPAEALVEAARGMDESFPDGRPLPGHHVFDVCVVDVVDVVEVCEDAEGTGRVVGYLWIGPSHGDNDRSWWVWDIVINESERGKGLGRAAMIAAEEFALSQGVTDLGLSVFGFNEAARRLYASLGFEVTSVKMSKTIARG